MGRIIDRRRVMGGESLPYDAKIEYLESTGTQWIDTGFNFKGSSKIEISFIGLAGKNLAVYGGSNGNGYTTGEFALFWNVNVFDVVIPNSNSQSGISIVPKPTYTINAVYNVSVDKTSFVINGTSYSIRMYNSYVCNRSLYLFATNRGNAIVPSITKLYYCKIYDGDMLVRDYIPVRVGTTGYMFDKVSGQLFGNSGTGSFILGPDKGAKNSNINVKTHSTGDLDASLDVIIENGEPVNIIYRNVPYDNGYIQVQYAVGSVGWQIYAITPCLYNGQVYNVGDLITNWVYTEIKDINIVANI